MVLRTATPTDAPFSQRLSVAARDIVRIGGPIVAAVWFVIFVTVGKPNSGSDVFSAWLVLQALFAIPALAYVSWLILSARLPGPSALDWGTLGILGVYTLAVLSSINPRVSLEASLLFGMAVISFYMVHDFGRLSTQFWARTLTLAVGWVSLLGLLSVLLQYEAWLTQISTFSGGLSLKDYVPPTLFRVQHVLDHPSPFAMFINLALPFVFVRALLGGRRERALAVIVIITGMGALFFSLTRGAWMATFAWGVVFAALVAARHDRRNPVAYWWLRLRERWLRRLAIVSLPAVSLLILALFTFDIRPDWLFRSTIDDRLEAFTTAIQIFKDHWLTGAGPYTYMLLDDLYADHSSGSVLVVHSHNLYLEVLAALGVLGAAVLVVCATILFRAFSSAWRSTWGNDRLYVAAGIAATLGFMVHCLSDAPHSWNSVVVPFAVVLGVTMRFAPRPTDGQLRQVRLLPSILVLGLVPLTLGFWIYFDLAHTHYDRSLSALRDGELGLAASEAAQATEADRGLYAYAVHAGVMQVRLYQSRGEAEPALLEQGIANLERAVSLEPYSALGHANLALAYQLQGDRDRAVTAARNAIVDEPGGEDILTASGSVLEWAGLYDEAASAYALAISLDPSLTQAPFWSNNPDRLTLRAAAIQRAESDACAVGQMTAIYGIYLDDLGALAERCASLVAQEGSPSLRSQLALILLRQGRLKEADQEATLALSEAPADKHVLLAEALALSDNIDDVRLHLSEASLARNREAGVLRIATYFPEAGSDLGASLMVPSSPEVTSDVVSRMVSEPLSDYPYEIGARTSSRSSIYYTWTAHRQAPSTTMIDGEWTTMAPPRLLISEAISAALAAEETGALAPQD